MKLNIKKNQKSESKNVANNAQVSNHEPLTVNHETSVNPEPEVEDAVVIEENTVDDKGKLPKVTFSTYKTKRGDMAPQIIGFGGEDDVRWKSHKDQNHSYVSASYRRDINGEKVYILMFGVRYMEVAKALAGAYNTSDVNAWHRAEDACMAIYEQAQRDGKARWEEKKRQWAERKAERDAAKNKPKCYTAEDVAAMIKAFGNGDDIPEDIQKLIAA